MQEEIFGPLLPSLNIKISTRRLPLSISVRILWPFIVFLKKRESSTGFFRRHLPAAAASTIRSLMSAVRSFPLAALETAGWAPITARPVLIHSPTGAAFYFAPIRSICRCVIRPTVTKYRCCNFCSGLLDKISLIKKYVDNKKGGAMSKKQ